MKITALLLLKCGSDGASDAIILANASDVSQFGYFQRTGAREFIVFIGRTVANRTPPGQRQSVQHEEYKVHSYNRNGLCAVAFMDDHYPVRSAFSLLNKLSACWFPPQGSMFRIGTLDTGSSIPLSLRSSKGWLSSFELSACWFPPQGSMFKIGTLDTGIFIDAFLKVLDEYQKNFGDSWRAATADATQAWPYLNEALTKFQDPVEADKLLKIQRDLDETKIILYKTIDSVLARGEKLDSLVEKSSDLSAASQVFYKQAKKTNQCCTIL